MWADALKFFSNYQQLESLDLLIPDLNGIIRGKRIKAALAQKAFSEGVLLPQSLFASDICGDTVDKTGLGIATGDQDRVCRPQADTLRLVPWAGQPAAQCMIEMFDANDRAFFGSPRHVLTGVVERMRAQGLHPTVAVELEFYLFRNQLDAGGMPQLLLDPVSGQEERSTQVYSMDDLDSFRPFVETVQRYCEIQSVPASAAIAEYAPGQFEINLEHRDDPLAACDDAVYLKRIIRKCAREQGMTASFMAKPIAALTGSGMHIHASIRNDEGDNLFAKSPEQLQHAVGGLQETMPEGMLLWAPHANSYRRYQENCYVPLSPSWGYNNRTVALRIPAGAESARRIEHRVSGADANPYLVMAGVLAGMLYGIQESCRPDQPIEGDAARQCEPVLPADWQAAVNLFSGSQWVSRYFNAEFRQLMATIKTSEYRRFQQHISPLDVQWYLQTV